MYATLGEEALIHGINESEVRFIITDGSLLGKLSNVIDRLPKVEHIVYLGNVAKKSTLLAFSRRIKVHSMREIEEIGESQHNCKLILLEFYLSSNHSKSLVPAKWPMLPGQGSNSTAARAQT